MNPRAFLPLFAVSAFLLLPQTQSQEWSRFRGKDGAGVGKMTGLRNEIKEGDYAWSTPLDGVGHSSPVLWGGKLFLTLAAADGTNRRL